MYQDSTPPEEDLTSQKVILIVENQPILGFLFVTIIQQETPYFPLLASTPERAIEMAQHIKPHLLLLDCHLPKNNGLDLYDFFHALPEYEDIPAIIMCTNLDEIHHEINQRHLHCLEMPMNLVDFLETIELAFACCKLSANQTQPKREPNVF